MEMWRKKGIEVRVMVDVERDREGEKGDRKGEKGDREGERGDRKDGNGDRQVRNVKIYERVRVRS